MKSLVKLARPSRQWPSRRIQKMSSFQKRMRPIARVQATSMEVILLGVSSPSSHRMCLAEELPMQPITMCETPMELSMVEVESS